MKAAGCFAAVRATENAFCIRDNTLLQDAFFICREIWQGKNVREKILDKRTECE